MSELNCTTLVTTCVLPLTNSENKISSITSNTCTNTSAYELHVNNINADFLNVGNYYNENKKVYICNSDGITVDCFVFDSGITSKDVDCLRKGTRSFNFKCNSAGTDLCSSTIGGIGGTRFLLVNCGNYICYLPVKKYKNDNGVIAQYGIGNSLFTNSGFNNVDRACKFALCATNTSTNTMVSYTVKANNFNGKLTSLVCNDSQVKQAYDRIKYYVCWETCSYCCARGHMVKISIKPLKYIECSAVNNEFHCIRLDIKGIKKIECNNTVLEAYENDTYSYCTIRGVMCCFLKDLTYTCCYVISGASDSNKTFTVKATRPTDYIYGRTDQCISKNASFTVTYKNPHSTGSGWQLIESGSGYIYE